MTAVSRRSLLQSAAALAAVTPAAAPAAARAAPNDGASIGWPSDVPSWDPNQRFVPDAQSLFKMVFDQPLDQDPSLKLIPHLIKAWKLSDNARTLECEFRDDVTFHNGDRLTAEDFRWTFLGRVKSGHRLDIAQSWRKVTDIEVASPTRAVMRFSGPSPTAPAWLAFLGSYVVPRDYMQKVGPEAFAQKPVGSGPYRLAEWEMNARIVLERNDAYWGPKPEIRRITVEIIKDPSARVAAVQSGQVDLTINVPVREVARLRANPMLAAELNPITRIILLQVKNDGGFADPNVRLAAHHAIDKRALSQAFYAGAAVPLSLLATPGSPGFDPSYDFAYDPTLSKAMLTKSGFSTDKPVRIRMATTNGQFPSDYDIARAIVAMWKKVGIEADLEVIEYAKYFELNRARKLPEATLYSFDNATADPEIFVGYLMNPKLPFSPWKDEEIGNRAIALFEIGDEEQRIGGWKKLARDAADIGACMPLLQSVQTLVRKQTLGVTRYGNGWVLGQTMSWG